jgi:hypothetical protein
MHPRNSVFVPHHEEYLNTKIFPAGVRRRIEQIVDLAAIKW